MLDPIAELVRDLKERGKPSLAWIVKWSQGDLDPVAAAWQQSRDAVAMFDLVAMKQRVPQGILFVEYVSNDRPVYGMSGLVCFESGGEPTMTLTAASGQKIKCLRGDPDAADALRRIINTPPPLVKLFSTLR